MAHEETVMGLMETLKIADKHTIGDIMATKVKWKPGLSTNNNSYKALCNLTDLKKLVKGDGYFALPECKSEYAGHAKFVTQTIAELLKLQNVTAIVKREITIPEVGLRPDAICLITRNNRGLCIILECLINETESYYEMKKNTWLNWPGATGYLSKLFNYKIPSYEIVPVTVVDGFKSFLMEAIRLI